jgi:hypothetical protein
MFAVQEGQLAFDALESGSGAAHQLDGHGAWAPAPLANKGSLRTSAHSPWPSPQARTPRTPRTPDGRSGLAQAREAASNKAVTLASTPRLLLRRGGATADPVHGDRHTPVRTRRSGTRPSCAGSPVQRGEHGRRAVSSGPSSRSSRNPCRPNRRACISPSAGLRSRVQRRRATRQLATQRAQLQSGVARVFHRPAHGNCFAPFAVAGVGLPLR